MPSCTLWTGYAPKFACKCMRRAYHGAIGPPAKMESICAGVYAGARCCALYGADSWGNLAECVERNIVGLMQQQRMLKLARTGQTTASGTEMDLRMECPGCRSANLRNSRLRLEDLLRFLLFQLPVRCCVCRERYYASWFTAWKLRKEQQRRRAMRRMKAEGERAAGARDRDGSTGKV